MGNNSSHSHPGHYHPYHFSLTSSSSTLASGSGSGSGSGGILGQSYGNLMAPGAYFIPGHHPNRRTAKPHTQQYVVTVPPNTKPGEKFRVLINNQEVLVTCPPGVKPSQKLTFTLPEKKSGAIPPPNRYMYEVTVPSGFKPGQPFVLLVGDQRVRVTCPPNARPGEKVRFQLPAHIQQKELESIKVDYDMDGWIRCAGIDSKFHWVYNSSKMSSSSSANSSKIVFDLYSDAFIRELIPPKSSNDPTGIQFIEATSYVMSANVPGTSIDSYELASIALLTYPKKIDWLKNHFTCSIRRPWEEGHYKIRVRRSHLLLDSVDSILTMPPSEMNKVMRYEFLGEMGLDAGGLTREWYLLVSQQLFHPNFGLFLFSNSNQMCLRINPHASVVHEDAAKYFYFTGRFLGRALLDTQLLSSHHFVSSFYKHLMGLPLTIHDLESIDDQLYRSLIDVYEMDNIEQLQLDFTVTEEILGVPTVIPLIPNGSEITVTDENKRDYIQKQLQYRLFESIKGSLLEILRGFYEVMSEPLLAVLSHQELELFLHGLPKIDVEDWINHTEYSGEFTLLTPPPSTSGAPSSAVSLSPSVGSADSSSSNSPTPLPNLSHLHEVCQWFWMIVASYSTEYRAKLLQFVTGTSGVPSLGFGSLQGHDGEIRLFTLHGNPNLEIFPRSHTCFNRIDLPLYKSKEEMEKYLTLAITCESVGFGLQ